MNNKTHRLAQQHDTYLAMHDTYLAKATTYPSTKLAVIRNMIYFRTTYHISLDPTCLHYYNNLASAIRQP